MDNKRLERVARSLSRSRNAARCHDMVNESNTTKYVRREASAGERALYQKPVTGKCWHGRFEWETCAACRRDGLSHDEVARRVVAKLREARRP